MNLQIAGFIEDSRVNGPGRRVVVWVQGCSLGCPGCFNPGTHAADAGAGTPVEALVARILAARGPETAGVTFSGGEPFQQAAALAAVAAALATAWPEGTRMAFSGYRLEELRGPAAPAGAEALLARLDWLVDGRFDARQPARPPLRGSANQRVWVLGRPLPPPEAVETIEVHLGPDGQVLLSGFPDAQLRRALVRALE